MLSTFCRSWILGHKPDPLYDFRVYQETVYQETNPAILMMNRLLIGIPGPKRSAWEGGLYPVLMNWGRRGITQPPQCKLPKDFHHVNIYPSGTICTGILNEREEWNSNLGIPDLLFAIQQRLAHPNPNSPAQHMAYISYLADDDRQQYNQVAKETAAKFTHDNFFELAMETFTLDAACWTEVHKADDDALFKGPNQKQPRPADPPAPTQDQIEQHGLRCTCSCCAWAASYEKNDLRMFIE